MIFLLNLSAAYKKILILIPIEYYGIRDLQNVYRVHSSQKVLMQMNASDSFLHASPVFFLRFKGNAAIIMVARERNAGRNQFFINDGTVFHRRLDANYRYLARVCGFAPRAPPFFCVIYCHASLVARSHVGGGV